MAGGPGPRRAINTVPHQHSDRHGADATWDRGDLASPLTGLCKVDISHQAVAALGRGILRESEGKQ